MRAWKGDYQYLLAQLIAKDFRVRYRNMSLGVFWSLLNPMVMLAVYYFIFTKIFVNPIPHFSIHVLCGLIIFNFYTTAMATVTTSLVDNAAIIKRVPVRREIIPIASILSNLTHLLIQFLLLLAFVVASGLGITVHYLWLPLVWGLELVFLVGLGLATSALHVFIRDTRYVVESTNLVLFWIVPIVYTFGQVPKEARDLYQYNPIAALVLATQNVILQSRGPGAVLLTKMAVVAVVTLAIGWSIFRRAEKRFYDSL
jgi:ABC-type polysaccharide/polyol phosphate export permease